MKGGGREDDHLWSGLVLGGTSRFSGRNNIIRLESKTREHTPYNATVTVVFRPFCLGQCIARH